MGAGGLLDLFLSNFSRNIPPLCETHAYFCKNTDISTNNVLDRAKLGNFLSGILCI